MLPAEGEELLLASGAADGVEEFRTDPLAEEVGIFLDLLDPLGLGDRRVADRPVEIVDVGEDFPACGEPHGLAGQMVSDLGKDPGVAHRAATDHQALRGSRPERRFRIARRGDIPVGQHGTVEGLRGKADQVVPDAAAVHLQHGAPVHGDEVDRVLGKKREERLDRPLRVESEACLDGELPRNRLPQGAENPVDAGEVAQQSAARALAVDDGCGTPKIQVDRRDGMVLQFTRAPHQRGNVVADHLRDGGAARGILRDRFEDRLVEPRGRIDPEVFRVVEIRAPIPGHQPPERQVGHILHRCQRQHGGGRGQQCVEIRAGSHFYGIALQVQRGAPKVMSLEANENARVFKDITPFFGSSRIVIAGNPIILQR